MGTIVSFVIINYNTNIISSLELTHQNPWLLTLLQLVYVKLHVDEDYEYDGDNLGMVRGELVKEDEEEEEEKTSVSRELARNRAYRNTFYRRGGKSSKSKYYMGGTKTYSSKSSKSYSSKSSKSKSSKGGGKKKKGRNRKNRKRRYPWEN